MKFILRLLLIVVLCGGAASAAVFNLDDAITESQKLAAEKKFEEAFDVLLKASLFAPVSEQPRLHAARGAVHRMAGDYVQAIDEFDKSVNLAPSDPCARVERALFYESIGENAASLADAELALDAGCSRPDISALRGRLYIWQDDPVDAIDYFTDAAGDNKQRPEALREIGGLFQVLGFPETSAAYLEESLRVKDDDAETHALLADSYSMLGRFDDSIAQYRRALELDPKNELASNNYAYSLFITGKTEEALAIFERLNREQPTPYSLCNVMEINIFKVKNEAAEQAGRLCLESFEKDPNFANYERYYKDDASLAVKLLYEDPEQLHPGTQFDLARRYIKDGEPAKALSATLVSLMLDPDDTEALFEAGRLYSLFGEEPKAGAFLNLALSLGGPSADFTPEARRLLFQNALSLIGTTTAPPVWYQSRLMK